MKKKRYVIWNENNRWGEFNFCCCTQANYCNTIKQAKDEIEGTIEDGDGEAEDHQFKIFEIILKEIK